ncbi:hypothetical protein GGR95_001646 [Sulfitobacter undariae]|uniref:Uncharacterized protein n=1 Tax=Sulfitobacter undariae TaxID=1563671 RepID=A0A7W6E8J8_9RHOB|nr:hypothetical protein [Sulfitobacter undariae]
MHIYIYINSTKKIMIKRASIKIQYRLHSFTRLYNKISNLSDKNSLVDHISKKLSSLSFSTCKVSITELMRIPHIKSRIVTLYQSHSTSALSEGADV